MQVDDETCTASINYTSGTTARPKGVQLTHRNLWLNASMFGWHTGVNDRDVLLHTLPMFHCNGWGMPYGITGMGAKHVVIRKIDGDDILDRVGPTWRDPDVRGSGRRAAPYSTQRGSAVANGDADPGRRASTRIVVAGAPPPSKIIEEVETLLGWEFIQIYGLTETSPLLTINRSPGE